MDRYNPLLNYRQEYLISMSHMKPAALYYYLKTLAIPSVRINYLGTPINIKRIGPKTFQFLLNYKDPYRDLYMNIARRYGEINSTPNTIDFTVNNPQAFYRFLYEHLVPYEKERVDNISRMFKNEIGGMILEQYLNL